MTKQAKKTVVDEPIPATTGEAEKRSGELPPMAPTPVIVDIRRIEHARMLPEVGPDEDTLPVTFADGSIERFKASEEDRRTMEIVFLPERGMAVRAVAEPES